MRLISLFVTIFYLFIISCSTNKNSIEIIEDKEIDLQMIDAYQEGLKALNERDGLSAAKKFSEAELLFPQSVWAPRAALMAAYSFYYDEYYDDTIYEVNRFLKTYPNHPRTDYAYYLLAISYYDQIVDETKDLNALLKSIEYFEILTIKYPKTDYAIDSTFKLELINEILASKEIFLARYYFEKTNGYQQLTDCKQSLKNMMTILLRRPYIDLLKSLQTRFRNEANYAYLLDIIINLVMV